MKTTMISLAILMMTSSVYATTLRVPYFVRDQKTNKVYSMDEVNPMLLARGERPFPEYAEFNEVTIKKIDRESYWQLYGKIDEALERAGLEDFTQQSENVPTSFNTKTAKTCYIGDATKVVDIVMTLADTFYSEQYTVGGWKYKTIVEYPYDNSEDTAQYLNASSKLWKNWNSKNDSVLIVGSVGDGGDDIQESVVGPCK